MQSQPREPVKADAAEEESWCCQLLASSRAGACSKWPIRGSSTGLDQLAWLGDLTVHRASSASVEQTASSGAGYRATYMHRATIYVRHTPA